MEINSSEILLTGIFLGVLVLCHQVHKIILFLTPAQAERINFYAEVNGIKRKVESMFLKVTQSLPVSLSITDKKGNAAKVDGAPQWAVTGFIVSS